jgi:hypothetical protein
MNVKNLYSKNVTILKDESNVWFMSSLDLFLRIIQWWHGYIAKHSYGKHVLIYIKIPSVLSMC